MIARAVKYFICCAACLAALTGYAQDTAKVDKKKVYRQARIATVMSAIVPGAGQFYNRKFWKPPIIYAGMAGFGYMFVHNLQQFQTYSNALRALNDNDPNTNPPSNLKNYNSDQLLGLKTQYRKNRDIGLIGFTVMYLVNIVDANVDAHLKTFDVSDDLSLNIRPYSNVVRTGPGGFTLLNGICLQLNFK